MASVRRVFDPSGANLYSNRGFIKILVVVMAFFISALSLWYTDALVKSLQDREKKLIDLFAKASRAVASSGFSDDQSFLFLEIIETNKNIPVILTDEKGEVISFRNLGLADDAPQKLKNDVIQRELALMKEQYPPIPIDLPGLKQFIYYRNSDLITQLKYYPFVQLFVIGLFGIIAYMAFSSSRRAEQNRVWVGLAKETAHQLGTPLSSLMAWIEYLRADERLAGEPFVEELAKDVEKLETITNRFSNIGSVPVLKDENVVEIAERLVSYLRRRISTKVEMTLRFEDAVMQASVNRALFEWVLENLIKNAVDAMAGRGKLDVMIGRRAQDSRIYIDVTDTGKGMPKNVQRRVFDPGYTTKSRGWGLGLTLSKRIMENYHQGKIYIRRSEPGVGTTFRVVV